MAIFRRNKQREIPDHELWRYAIVLYEKKGISDACLLLQNNYKLNVNIILCCCWMAASGRGLISKHECRGIIQLIKPWQEKLTDPLRKTRDKIFKQTSHLQPLRNSILELEIYTEKAQQMILFDYLCGHFKRRRGARQKAEDGMVNLQNYFSVTKTILDEAGYAAVRVVLAAAFDRFVENDFPQMSLTLEL